MGKGCERQAPFVPKGEWGLPDAPLGGAGGGKQRASNEQARRLIFGSSLGGAREGVRTANPKVPYGVGDFGVYRARPWVGRGAASSEQATSKQEGKWLGAPWGAHGKGCERQALSSRRANRAYRTRPWVGRGKLQQARLLCPRITGAKGVNLVDMRY